MTQAATKRALTPAEAFNRDIVAYGPEIRRVLPNGITEEKFLSVLQTAATLNPNIVSADRNTLYAEVLKCAQDGLLPDGREAVINVYAGKPKYLPMIVGICKRIRNSGEITVVDAHVVYENDKYRKWVDEKGSHFEYERTYQNRGKPILTFAYAIGKDGTLFFEEVDESQMSAIENVALSKLSEDKKQWSPWRGDFRDEMKEKSAIHRLAKYRLPSSADIEGVLKRIEEDFDFEAARNARAAAASPKKEPGRPTRTMGIVEGQVVQEPAPVAEPAKTAPAPEVKTPPAGAKTAEGAIEQFNVKSGARKGKNNEDIPWTKFSISVGGKWYATFDTKIGEQFEVLVDSHATVRVTYTEEKKGDAVYLTIFSVEEVIGEQEPPI